MRSGAGEIQREGHEALLGEVAVEVSQEGIGDRELAQAMLGRKLERRDPTHVYRRDGSAIAA